MADAHLSAAAPGTAQPETALGHDDFKQLYQMSMSDDSDARSQAATLASKLTPQEHQAFFDYQKSQHPQGEHGRVDNQVAGVPPELAALMVGPIAKVATQAGLTVGNRIGQTFKAALGQAHPVVKYEITRSALQHLGIPAPLAMGVAIAVSGYKKGTPPTATTAATEAAPAAAEASAVGTTAPVPVAPPAAAQAAPVANFNHGQAMNDVRGMFRQIKVTPAPAEVSNAASLMRHGKTAEEAVARVLEQRPGVDLKAAAKLAEKLGLPSDATVASRVADRNATGRWSQ